MEMDWNKYGSSKTSKVRRVPVTVGEGLEQAIAVFKQYHPDVKSDSSVLLTMAEAGFKVWGAEMAEKQRQAQTQDTLSE